jgi:hypothetical protein
MEFWNERPAVLLLTNLNELSSVSSWIYSQCLFRICTCIPISFDQPSHCFLLLSLPPLSSIYHPDFQTSTTCLMPVIFGRLFLLKVSRRSYHPSHHPLLKKFSKDSTALGSICQIALSLHIETPPLCPSPRHPNPDTRQASPRTFSTLNTLS